MTINYTKLRIGDVVSVNVPKINTDTFELENTPTPGVVVMLSTEGAVVEGNEHTMPTKSVVGYPITKEFLLQNGFVKKEGDSFFLLYDEETYIHIIIEEKKVVLEAKNANNRIVVCDAFVHNLQHVANDYNFIINVKI